MDGIQYIWMDIQGFEYTVLSWLVKVIKLILFSEIMAPLLIRNLGLGESLDIYMFNIRIYESVEFSKNI